MTNLEKFIIAVLIVVVLAEVFPEPVNVVLLLVLIGLVLTQYQSFSELFAQLGTLNPGGTK